jgi:hypothetical protein
MNECLNKCSFSVFEYQDEDSCHGQTESKRTKTQRHESLFILLLSYCSMFALQLKAVLLLDTLQLLMLSAGNSISFEDKMSPLNIFYYKQDTHCLYDIYLLNSIVYIIFFHYYYYRYYYYCYYWHFSP